MSASSARDTDPPDPGTSSTNHVLERVNAHADRLLEFAEHGVTDVNALGSQPAKDGSRTLDERLLELHIEETLKDRLSWSSHLNPCSNLLATLCKREATNKLIVDLLPDSQGYQLSATTTDGQVVEFARLPYSEDALLSCLDAQEVPAFLSDLLRTSVPGLFYNGCVIAEVRDQRRIGSPPDVSHLLLRPTTQSIICDSNVMAKQASAVHGRPLTQEERFAIEGQVALASEPRLCLDPNPVVSVVVRKAAFNRQRFATAPMRKALRKHSHVGISRKRKLDSAVAANPPQDLRLHDYIQNNSDKCRSAARTESLARHQERARAVIRGLTDGLPASQLPADLEAPFETDVLRHARALPKRAETIDNTPVVLEEYILKSVYAAERGVQKVYYTRLTIYQRWSNDEYLGELYVERDYKEGEKKGSTCRFVLGTRQNALSYINQFTEIFTEEGRKSVEITHQVPNQPPRVTYTPGMRERMNDRAAAVAAQAAQQQAAAQAAAAAQSQQQGATVLIQPQQQQVVAAAAVASSSPALTVSPVVSSAAATAAAAAAPKRLMTGASPILAQTLLQPTSQAARTIVVSQHQPVVTLAARQPVGIVTTASGTSLLQAHLTVQPSNIVQQQQQQQQQPAASNQQFLQVNKVELPQQQQQLQQPQQQQQHLAGNSITKNESNTDEQSDIAAIMKSLMEDSAQFETDKANQPGTSQHQQLHQQQLIASPQLPTCPVPAASLGAAAVNSPTKCTTPNSNGSRVVTLQSLLSSPVAAGSPTKQQQHSQLAAQLQRPPQTLQPAASEPAALPSYSQALQQQQQQAAALQTSPSPKQQQRLSFAQQQQQPSVLAATTRRSTSIPPGSGSPEKDPNPTLQALLTANPVVDEAGSSNGVGASSSTSQSGSSQSLLERLVSGQAVSTMSSNSTMTTAASSNEITLAALLAKPTTSRAATAAVAAASGNGTTSPAKMSPLLQQLQQPIPPPRPPSSSSSLPSPRMTSPRRPPSSPSPRTMQQRSPRPATPGGYVPQSPRMIMQPPPPSGKPAVTTTASLLSAQLQQPLNIQAPVQQVQQQQPQQVHLQPATLQQQPVQLQQANGQLQHQLQQQQQQHAPNGVIQGPNGTSGTVVSLQNLLQCGGVVQVSSVPAGAQLVQQPVQVTANSVQPATSSNSIQVLQIPGLAAPVTLSTVSVNLPNNGDSPQKQLQQQQQQQQAIQQQQQQQKKMLQMQQPGQMAVQMPNVIQLPQQPAAAVVAATAANSHLKPLQQQAVTANHLQPQQIKPQQLPSGQVLQVRQTPTGQNVYVQVSAANPVATAANPAVTLAAAAAGQPIQIVRQMPQQAIVRAVHQQQAVVQPQQLQAVPQQQQLFLNSGLAIKSPPGQPPTASMIPSMSPQTGSGPGSVGSSVGGGVPPSPVNSSAIMSPPTPMGGHHLQQGQHVQHENMVAIQLDGAGGSGGGGGGGATHPSAAAGLQLGQAAPSAAVKMRTHRKSLK